MVCKPRLTPLKEADTDGQVVPADTIGVRTKITPGDVSHLAAAGFKGVPCYRLLGAWAGKPGFAKGRANAAGMHAASL